ncbi:MAG TPA: GMC family oxidoreductase [Casimicrobiaceae bacterium]|jgi:choline dehydrogenase-like flavoprotein|nr:GMC family oxidoreductase [Casimicrobiaceae bacterium]
MNDTATPRIADPIRAGLAAGWDVVDASTLDADLAIDADVAIVGSGAGGGVTAETLALAGLKVVVLEEGPLRSSTDFRMREAEAYPELYQESAARKTADKAINILQGRCVGGGTTVNWTSSFRTPPVTLAHWARTLGIPGLDGDALAPWFAKMEARLGIAPWEIAPNVNNAALSRGAAKLGIASAAIRRNVRACWNLGYCGMGCPTNAKQSMLVTTLPAALALGAKLVTRVRAERLVVVGDRVDRLEAVALDPGGTTPTARRVTVRARSYVAAAGAIGSPALLLRSGAPDPAGLTGRRTFLHPTVVSAALMPERVDGFAGAPQTIYSDHWLDTLSPGGPAGFKVEAAPVHPVLAAITMPGHGEAHARWMGQLPHMHVLIALIRDGFHPESAGGTVRLRDDGTPVLDYPQTPYLFDAVRRAFAAMAELQFAAGSTSVMPVQGRGEAFTTRAAAARAIGAFALAPLVTPMVSAHVMGGCPIGPDPKRAVVDMTGRHHHLANLHVIDGSLFPTSIGANPQLSIYAFAAKLADGLAATLGQRARGA